MRVATPDGMVAAVLLAILTTAGIFYVNIMAALVEGWKVGLHFSARDAGLIGSCNVYGAAVGAGAAAFLAARLPWRRTARRLLCILIAIDVACIFIHKATLLMSVRFLHGVVGGMLVGIGVMVIARTRIPDRGFGMLLIVQFTLGGLGIIVLPGLAAAFGTWVLFMALITLSALTLLALPFIPEYPLRESQRAAAANPSFRVRPALIAALAAILLFQAFSMSTSAYSIGMGESFGLAASFVSLTLGLGTWIGLLGAGAVVVFGLRFGRLWPLVLGIAIDVACNIALVFGGNVPWIWVVANSMGSITWAFVLPYLYGLVSAFDTNGRTAPWAGFCSKVGLASGPAAGALLLMETHYTRLLLWASLIGILAAILVFSPARQLDASSNWARK